MPARLVGLIAAVVAVAACNCGKTVCVPGATQECVGPAGCHGGQACKDDGSGYEACDCGGTDGGSGGGSGGGGSTSPCSPLMQTGCAAGQRCTWVYDPANNGTSFVACVDAGTVDAGEACTRPDSQTLNSCKGSSFCVDERCAPLCGPDAGVNCPAQFTCDLKATPPGEDGGYLAGACVPTCDPVTQRRDFDGAAACGSPSPATPSKGCYESADDDNLDLFVCDAAGNAAYTSDVPAEIVGHGSFPFPNGCAPGFLPLLLASSGSSTIICTAFCKPAPTTTATQGNAAGEPDSGFRCPDRGAVGKHECRYAQSLQMTPDALGNTIGYCFDYSKYTYMLLDGGTAPMPSCKTVNLTAKTADPTVTDAVYFGCVPNP